MIIDRICIGILIFVFGTPILCVINAAVHYRGVRREQAKAEAERAAREAAKTPGTPASADAPASDAPRKRGRPRKYPPKDPNAPKRPVGRPRKNPPPTAERPETIPASDPAPAAPAPSDAWADYYAAIAKRDADAAQRKKAMTPEQFAALFPG